MGYTVNFTSSKNFLPIQYSISQPYYIIVVFDSINGLCVLNNNRLIFEKELTLFEYY
jgi:hypothetical protein